MADVAFEARDVLGVEDVDDVAHAPEGRELATVARDDARALLAAVLQRVQTEVREVCSLRVAEDAEDAAHRGWR